ncbi:MAG: FprA family A-type flavoprotein, partial [Anaerolineaceae bacterium]|nr:FprA family A-type flavoprotein [Anaerolineaceae bacterium]
MKRQAISERVWLVGAVDWERTLFDSLIPLPHGTSYNAYLVQGSQKTALIDGVDPTKTHRLLDRLADVPRIDYVIANHAEQDHSGAIPRVLEKYPSAKVMASTKCKSMLIDLLHLPEERVQPVEDGEILSLGDRTLEFIYTPWVHWPETMSTYLREEKILFSCDFFGSHLATSDAMARDQAVVYQAAKRYYAEIMMPFRQPIEKNLDRLAPYELSMIAPSHGPVYDQPAFILDAYREWVSAPPKNLVVLPYISMHDSTRRLVEHLIDALIERGVSVQP